MSNNKMTYQEMLDLLKGHQYAAPNRWEEIAGSLDLSQGLTDLPLYQAPDHLWDNIEVALDSPTVEPDRVDRYQLYLKLAGMAIVFLSLIVVYLLSTRTEAVSEFQYRSEVELASMDNQDLEVDENLDEVLSYIEANEFIFDADELKQFKQQLAELNAAIERIKEMKEIYGQDESSVKLLARIERDKADLLRTMISATS